MEEKTVCTVKQVNSLGFCINENNVFFIGFSVGFCINEEEGYLLPTIYSSENNLPTFRLNAPVVIRAKVKEVRTKHYYL